MVEARGLGIGLGIVSRRRLSGQLPSWLPGRAFGFGRVQAENFDRERRCGQTPRRPTADKNPSTAGSGERSRVSARAARYPVSRQRVQVPASTPPREDLRVMLGVLPDAPGATEVGSEGATQDNTIRRPTPGLEARR